MGGIHSSLNTDEAIQFVDAVVVGEAEGVWQQVIKDFENNALKKVYESERLDLSQVPTARHDLFDKRYLFGSIQTARGCPMNCDFCSVTSFNGNTYRQRPVESILDELEQIPQKMVFFVDDNIIGYGNKSKDRALSLFKGIIERKIKKQWFCQASLNFADDEEVLEYASKSGCRMVFIGLEAENKEALKDAHKNLNLKMGTSSYESVFKKINKHKIAVLGAFIYGLDSDTITSLERRTDYMTSSNVDVMQTTVLTPLPGTKLFQRMREENRLLHANFPDDWVHYDMTEAVFKPKNMSASELNAYMGISSKKIGKSIFLKFFKTLFSTKSFTTAIWALNSNLNYYNISSGKRFNWKALF